jgi:hypothetical protein
MSTMADGDFPEVAMEGLEAFIDYARNHHLRHAVIVWRDEYGPLQLSAERVSYQQCRELTVLGYHHGTVVRFTSGTLERAAVRARLLECGLWVEERCRNLNAGLPRAVGPRADAQKAPDAP